MYAAIALALVIGFVLVTVALPLRFDTILGRLSGRLYRTVLCSANQAIFQSEEETARQASYFARLWFITAALIFTILGLQDGAMIRNHPESIATVAVYGGLALGASSFVLLSFLAYARFLPGFLGYRTLSRCGFRGLWLLRPQRTPERLARELREQARRSGEIKIVDVTGFELFVKGTGSIDTLIHQAIRSSPDVPVSLLLLNPMTREVDPDRLHVSVFQTVLAETGLQSSTYMKKIQKTLQVIAAMNQERSEEGQIQVRFYNEKPAIRAVIFDESMIVFPWGPQALRGDTPCLQVARLPRAPSFYETFRRSFSTQWKKAVMQVFTSMA